MRTPDQPSARAEEQTRNPALPAAVLYPANAVPACQCPLPSDGLRAVLTPPPRLLRQPCFWRAVYLLSPLGKPNP